MKDNDRIPFDDEFIKNRLKEKARQPVLLYVLTAVFILTEVVIILIICTENYVHNVPNNYFLIIFTVVLILFCIGVFTYLILKQSKFANSYKKSKGEFTVTTDTIIYHKVKETYTAKRRSEEYTLTLANHDEFVTHNLELTGLYIEDNEKCYVVSFVDSPDIPALVFNARIYEYKGDRLK